MSTSPKEDYNNNNSTADTLKLSEEAKARIKEDGRDVRLSFRNFGEHQLRKELKEIAVQNCRQYIQEFGKCANEQGLWVVINCREHNKKIGECMSRYNSEEQWQKYKAQHEQELQKWEDKHRS